MRGCGVRLDIWVIDTLQREGYKEGVDDTRYLATLLDAIDKAGLSKTRDADAARQWLDTVPRESQQK